VDNEDATDQHQHDAEERQPESSPPNPTEIKPTPKSLIKRPAVCWLLFSVALMVALILVLTLSSWVVRDWPPTIWILLAFAILLGSLLAVIFIPKWQISRMGFGEERDRFKTEDDARKTLAQIIAGVFLIVGAFSAYQNFRLAEKGQITDRFNRAVPMLADKERIEVRLGGIYTLEGVARDSHDYYWPIMALFTDYLREHYPWKSPWKNSPWIKDEDYKKPGTADVSAVLTVIGRLNNLWKSDRELDFAHTYLRGAYLLNTDYSNLQIQSANLVKASFMNVDFRKTNFENSCLDQASFLASAEGKQTDLTGAKFNGASIRGTDFRGAKGLNLEQFRKVIWNEFTKLPEAVCAKGKVCLSEPKEPIGQLDPCELN
jgi:hypothetical protein